MHVQRSQVASFYQAQGYKVTERPSLIGASGAVYTPDLLLVKDRTVAVFVVPGRVTGELVSKERMAAKDLRVDAVVVAEAFDEEAFERARHYEITLLEPDEVGLRVAQAPLPVAEEPAAPVELAPPAPLAPEPLPLSAFEPPPAPESAPAPPEPRRIDPLSNEFLLHDPGVRGTADRLADVQRAIREGRTFERTTLREKTPAPALEPSPLPYRSAWLASLAERGFLNRTLK
ncbi:MAG TPA: hypothetical protein VM681_10150 [Candidatus Thermoplasmatota archaeon]|nr:hypothetical protein [Candidatus Thermoplasmatota archaeon]